MLFAPRHTEPPSEDARCGCTGEDERPRPYHEAPCCRGTPGCGPREGHIWESRYCSLRRTARTLRTAGVGVGGTWAPGRHPGLQSWAQRAAFLSSAGCHQGHQLVQAPGREVRQEGEGKEDRGLGKKGGGAHRAAKAGPNLAVSYFRTVPWGPQTRDTGGGESACANAPNPQLLQSRQLLLGSLGQHSCWVMRVRCLSLSELVTCSRCVWTSTWHSRTPCLWHLLW